MAIILMPQDPIVNDHFADCLWMNNHKIKARYYWKNVLNLEKELSELTGLGINIDFDSLNKTGTIKIECKNLEEFNYIINKIKT